ncbi:MAG: metallophosphoesterase [Anaerolineae bacterium]|nr:metallophosphoesterase [Anaerolineae bacterium]
MKLPLKSISTLFGLTLAAAVAYAHYIEPGWTQVRYVRLQLPRLGKAFHGYMIAQIADIHMGSWMTRDRLQANIDIVNAIRPDLVAITGDFVDRRTFYHPEDLIEPLRSLKPVDATVAVLGNHDYRFNRYTIGRALEASGVIELPNRVHTLQRGGDQLHIAGVDNILLRQDCIDAVLDQLPPTGAAVLLAHEPDFADVSAPTGRFDLQLSGHTHGGQIRLPLLPVPVRPELGYRYPAGRYQVGDMVQYTNRGLGMISPFLRFNARPEITVFILESM